MCARRTTNQVLTPSSGFLDFAISMRPDYHQAIIDTISFYGWKKIIYLYDSHDGKWLLLLSPALKYSIFPLVFLQPPVPLLSSFK